MLCVQCETEIPFGKADWPQFQIARPQQGNTPTLYICLPCVNKNIGEEKMMQNIGTSETPLYITQGSGRIRLNITKNTKGRNFDYTVELGAGDNSWLKQGMEDILREVRAFDLSVVELVHELEMNDARKAQG